MPDRRILYTSLGLGRVPKMNYIQIQNLDRDESNSTGYMGLIQVRRGGRRRMVDELDARSKRASSE